MNDTASAEVISYRGRQSMRQQRHFFSDWAAREARRLLSSRLDSRPRQLLVVRFVGLRRTGLTMLGLTRQHGGRILRRTLVFRR
jgi:hypothetical protein